jgi:hypothetical protein
MTIRDRIKELRRVRPCELRPNPRNWREHPPAQQAALRGILAEVGFADALLVRELADGSLEIIDGHLRAEVAPDEPVPVLVLDVSAEEAAKLLATHDSITGLARPDFGQLRRLLDECDFQQPALHAMFRQLRQRNEQGAKPGREITIPSTFQVVVTCSSEADQRDLYERLTADGRTCRLIVL